MTEYRKQPGTPNYHIASARNGRQANNRVTRRVNIPGEIERENQKQAFKTGLYVGIAASCLMFALILWLWIIPTMDAAVATAQGLAS